MRIAILNAHGADTAYGGAEVAIARLIDGLEGLGHEVGLVAGLPTERRHPNLIATVQRRPWRATRARHVANVAADALAVSSRRVEAILRSYEPDAALTHNLPGLSTAAWARARSLGIPVVHTIHDYYLLCRRTTLQWGDGGPCRDRALCEIRRRSILRFADAVSHVLAPSRYVADRHAGLFPAAPPIEVLVNPSGDGDLSAIQPPRSLARLGFIGRLDGTKGVALLIDAAPLLTRLGVVVAIAGSGPLRNDVEDAAARGVLEYVGRVEGAAKRDFIASCDAGVAPSLWDEPGGPTLTMSEWLAAGRPVFASLRGGHIEVAAAGCGVVGFAPTCDSLVETVARGGDDGSFATLTQAVRRDLAPSVGAYARRYEAAIESARTRLVR